MSVLWSAKLKKMYEEKRATKKTLKNAVLRGWLTEEEYQDITGEKYEA